MLFPTVVYGPVHSRRLGISLGINLMPVNAKLCSFDCVYCECGFNTAVRHPSLPTRQEVGDALEKALQKMEEGQKPDVITFSGNGEPTLHPDFRGIIEDTCALRDRYCPDARVSVLSNSTQLEREDVWEGLRMADNRILKLDSGIDSTMRLIDRPVNRDLTVEILMTRLKRFKGDFILQTCFLRGEYLGQRIDNTTPEELEAWYRCAETLAPKQIMIYVIDRATPVPTLEKIPREEMESIAAPLRRKGFEVVVSA